MTAQFPNAIYSSRVVENLNGLTRDVTDAKNLYAEDYNEAMEEITAIETILGLNPQAGYFTVADYIFAVDQYANGLTSKCMQDFNKIKILQVAPDLYYDGGKYGISSTMFGFLKVCSMEDNDVAIFASFNTNQTTSIVFGSALFSVVEDNPNTINFFWSSTLNSYVLQNNTGADKNLSVLNEGYM